ncbi:MAG: hypothetical protein HW412_1749 [Bacteroidetes bacterium]|nr:hypothetical protein [Bacteroidota bacterium]
MNDNMGVLEQYEMPQALAAERINALLVVPQGPYRARDSFGGKMEDEGGLKRLIEDVLVAMKGENVIKTAKLDKLILSAHSGGYRPAAFCLDRGGLNDHITDVFLFDAFYGNHDFFRRWLSTGHGKLFAAYTDHLAGEHKDFMNETIGDPLSRINFSRTSVDHDQVVHEFLGDWLSKLDKGWKTGQR